jgi:ribonuclease PH
MNIVMTSAREFIEIQGTAERRTFSQDQMNRLLSLAGKGIGELIDMQRAQLKDVFSL